MPNHESRDGQSASERAIVKIEHSPNRDRSFGRDALRPALDLNPTSSWHWPGNWCNIIEMMHQEQSAALRNDIYRIDRVANRAGRITHRRCWPILLLIGIRWSPEHRRNFLPVTISVSRSRASSLFAALPLTRPTKRPRGTSSQMSLYFGFTAGASLTHVIPQDPSSFSAF